MSAKETNGAVDSAAADRLFEVWAGLRAEKALSNEWLNYVKFCRDINREGLDPDEKIVSGIKGRLIGPSNYLIVIGGPSTVSRDLIDFDGKTYTVNGAAKYVGLGEQQTHNLHKQGKLIARMERARDVGVAEKPTMVIVPNSTIQKGLAEAEVLDTFDFDATRVTPRESRREVFDAILDGKIRAIDSAKAGYESPDRFRYSIQAYVRRCRPDIRLRVTIRKSDNAVIVQSVPIDRPPEQKKEDAEN